LRLVPAGTARDLVPGIAGRDAVGVTRQAAAKRSR
jgi:hypothetical protein